MGEQQIVSNRIRKPIGCPLLNKFAKGKKSILIVTDDNTRQTPLKRILPCVLAELKNAGIKDSQVKILIASGTHRLMTRRELLDKFGKAILSRFKIYNHKWNDKSLLTKINYSLYKKKIWVNKLAKKSDFIIGIGSIVPHVTVGFSGGGKIILPGICGRETVEDVHWKALDFRTDEILGKYDNHMRRIIDYVARKVGLKFIVNVIMNGSNKIFDVVAGDPVKAHRRGVEIAKQIFGLKIPHLADIVIADAKPMDIDLRQAIKAIASADMVVRKGGIIVLIARCPEGVSSQFPEFEKYGFKDPAGLKRKIEEGKIKGKLMAYTLIGVGRILKDKAKVILVSRGISRKTAQRLGFLWADSLKGALKKAKKFTSGRNKKVIYLKRACEILPLLMD